MGERHRRRGLGDSWVAAGAERGVVLGCRVSRVLANGIGTITDRADGWWPIWDLPTPSGRDKAWSELQRRETDGTLSSANQNRMTEARAGGTGGIKSGLFNGHG